jgi:hypothetical protein
MLGLSMGMARAAAAVILLLAAACGGDDDGDAGAPATSGSNTTARPPATTTPRVTTVAPPEGVETFTVEVGHTENPVTYPQTPPVGGIHHPAWQRCGFYEEPVRNELAVHSLEHGVIWITYRPDVPQEEKDVLSQLARSRGGILVSRWDEGLPAPVVASSWGRQMKLQSATDARLRQFILAFSGDAPEPLGSCD